MIEGDPNQVQLIDNFDKNISDFFQPGYVHRTIDSLPENISSDVRKELKARKKDIPVSTKSDLFSLEDINFEKRDYLHENLSEGAKILNEICTSTLTSKIVYKGKLENKLDSYENYFDNLIEILELDDTFVGLIEHLEISMLSGDFKNVNDYLKANYQRYPNLHTLCHEIGMMSNLVNSIYVDKDTQKAIKEKKFVARVALFIVKNLFARGAYKPSEEKIYINKILDTIERFSTLFVFRDNPKTTAAYIHETIHYLSHEKSLEGERVGFSFFSEENFEKLKEN